MLAITVDTLLDNLDSQDGRTTLREAIAAATPGETIDFSVTGTISLGHPYEEILIDKSLTITGPGQELLTIDAGHGDDNLPGTGDGFRIFRIEDSDINSLSDVSISGLTLTGGDLEINSGLNAGGGAIRNSENLRLENSTITGNFSSNIGGGIFHQFGTLRITNSELSENSSGSYGGAIYNARTAYIENSILSDNSADDSGGALIGDTTIENSSFLRNTAGYNGGAIESINSSTISGTTFSENTAAYNGGAIHTRNGTLNIVGSTVSGNSATLRGGGINSYSAASTISNSTISNNTAYDGAGIAHQFDDLLIANSTITNNTATGLGGGLFVGAGNINFPSIARVISSIIAGNSASADSNVSGSLNSNSFNLIDGDAMLDVLADNGGPTQTHALLPGSPALNSGSEIPLLLFFDQRGGPFLRNDGNGVDIGAFEAQTPPTPDFDTDGDVDGTDFLVWQRGFSKIDNVSVSDGDANADGQVDDFDLQVWSGTYGVSTSPAIVSNVASLADNETTIDAALAAFFPSNSNLDAAKVLPQTELYYNPITVLSVDAYKPTSSHGNTTNVAEASPTEDESAVSAQTWPDEELLEKIFA